jgi:hypothetical protein
MTLGTWAAAATVSLTCHVRGCIRCRTSYLRRECCIEHTWSLRRKLCLRIHSGSKGTTYLRISKRTPKRLHTLQMPQLWPSWTLLVTVNTLRKPHTLFLTYEHPARWRQRQGLCRRAGHVTISGPQRTCDAGAGKVDTTHAS